MASPAPSSPTTPQFAAEHQQQLLDANRRARKIYNAARMASFNGWCLAVMVVLSLPFCLFSFSSLVVLAGLAWLAYNEFQGRNRLRQFDAAAARMLGWNQLALMGLILLYCAWSIGAAMTGEPPFAEELRAHPELTNSLGSLGPLYRSITLLVYGVLAMATAMFQGINAWYYFSREQLVREYVETTPSWILELQRSTAA